MKTVCASLCVLGAVFLTGCASNEVRVRAAVRLLKETTSPILDVALACGFGNLSHFYHVFRRLTGQTPRALRSHSED